MLVYCFCKWNLLIEVITKFVRSTSFALNLLYNICFYNSYGVIILMLSVEEIICPRNYAGDVWWDGTQFSFVRIIDCPHGAVGKLLDA